MFALFSRILKLSGRYKGRIQGAFVCAFLESILSKMPIFLAFVILSGFAAGTLTGQTCLYVGIGLAAAVLVQMLVHYLSDSLQSAAGYLMFADKRMELGGHLRKLPMGYFTSGNIGKISSVLSTDMVFIEEVAMSTLGNMMSYLLSSLVLLAFMFYLNWQLGLIAAIVTILAWLVSKGMNKVSLREAAGRQEQSERLTDAVLSFVEGIGVIKSYNLLGEKSEELTGNFRRSRNTSLAFERKMTPWTMGLNILYGIGIAAIFGLAIFLEQNGGLSLAYVLGVLLFVFDLFGPLKALYGEASRLTVMNAALDRIEAVLDEPELPDTGKQHLPSQAQPGQPEVQFSDVAFAYQDKEVLEKEIEIKREIEKGRPARAYGRYQNVFLTDEELADLQASFPTVWGQYIEKLSEYMASTGKRYQSHAATIRRWASEDAKKAAPPTRNRDYSVKEDETV